MGKEGWGVRLEPAKTAQNYSSLVAAQSPESRHSSDLLQAFFNYQ